MADVDQRFRQAHDYAVWHGYADAFPNFHEANYGDGVVYGTILVPSGTADFRDVPAVEYGVFDREDVPAMFRAATDYANRNGYGAGLPTFHEADYGSGLVFGTFLFRPGGVDWRDVPADTLGVLSLDDVPGMMRAANDYADGEGYAAGFPTFHQADHGAGTVYGIILLRPGAVSWRDVPADLLAAYTDASSPWAVILCRPSDVPDGDSQRWRDMMLPGGADPSNGDRYWTELSYGQYDAQGSRVFGWFDVRRTSAEATQFGDSRDRTNLGRWGREAAERGGVRLDRFRHVAYCYNINADHGSVGGNEIVLAYAEGRAFEPVFMHHEMGHALGLEHSSSQVEGEYGDDYDMMSAVRRVKTFRDARDRAAGPGLAAPNLERSGWLHRSRVWQSFPLTSQLITLAAINRTEIDGYLAAKLSWWPFLRGPVWVEYRQPDRWDRGLNEPVVLVHRRNAMGGAELAGGRSNRQGRLRDGEEYAIAGAFTVIVRVEAIDAVAGQARVRLWALTTPGPRTVRVVTIDYDPPGVEYAGEAVLIRNDQSTPADLTGWRLEDVAGHRYSFPALVLRPGHEARIWTGEGVDDGQNLFWGRRAAIWNNAGDTATLYDAGGAVVSRYSYGNGG